jgi:hypothetical protein
METPYNLPDYNIGAVNIVVNYIKEHLDKSDGDIDFQVYVVWQCCILGSRKWLISSTLPDGMYYEVTYDYHKGLYYLDAYKKFENRAIPVNQIRPIE